MTLRNILIETDNTIFAQHMNNLLFYQHLIVVFNIKFNNILLLLLSGLLVIITVTFL